jgi:hypothetical protein
MHTYNTSPPADELTRAQTELNQVKDIMVQNVEQILSRGERIELLVDKTDVMAGQATAFRRGARTVRREMWWKNKKIIALSVLVALVSGFLISIYDVNELNFSDFLVDSRGPSLWPWTQPMWFKAQNRLINISPSVFPLFSSGVFIFFPAWTLTISNTRDDISYPLLIRDHR